MKSCVDMLDRSKFAGADTVLCRLKHRVIAIMERIHQHATRRLSGALHSFCFPRVLAKRFLTEHMLSGFQRRDGPFSVCRNRQGNINSIDIRVINHRLIVLADTMDAMRFGKILRSRWIPCCNHIKAHPINLSSWSNHRQGRDSGRAEQSKSDRRIHHEYALRRSS